MTKRRATRIISFVLVFLLLLSSVSAANEVQPRYEKMDGLAANLIGVSWLGKVTCVGLVTLWDTTCTASLTVELQRSPNGTSSWDTIKSWNQSGDYDIIIEEDWYVTSGYYYRVAAVAIIYDANGAYVEMDIATSGVVQY